VARHSRNSEEILDWEELEQAPNVRGAFSFLAIPGQVVNIDRNSDAQQGPGTPPQLTTVDITSTVDKTSTVETLRPQYQTGRPYRVHRCSSVQDGHSHGETILYDILWRLGTGSSKEYREVTIGWDCMAREARMSDKAAKRNLTQLISKLAVELVEKEDSAGEWEELTGSSLSPKF